eukprot:3862811-Pleurochrysis_carterae.AAC.1
MSSATPPIPASATLLRTSSGQVRCAAVGAGCGGGSAGRCQSQGRKGRAATRAREGARARTHAWWRRQGGVGKAHG